MVGSFECRTGSRDRIGNLKDIYKYFVVDELNYTTANNHNRFDAEFTLDAKLDWHADEDKIYSHLSRSLGQKNYWPYALAGTGIGAVFGPVGAAVGFLAPAIYGAIRNRTTNKVEYQTTVDPVTGDPIRTYELEGPTAWDVFKSKVKNIIYRTGEDPIEHRREIKIEKDSPMEYSIEYAGEAPKKMVAKDANAIWRAFKRALFWPRVKAKLSKLF